LSSLRARLSVSRLLAKAFKLLACVWAVEPITSFGEAFIAEFELKLAPPHEFA
jgi:hypothetical protein